MLMKNSINILAQTLSIILLVSICLFACVFFTSTSLVFSDPVEPWSYATNFYTNSYVSLRQDHLSQMFTSLIPGFISLERPLALLIPLAIGLMMYCSLFIRATLLKIILLGLTPIVFVLYASGVDPLVLATVAWAPLCATLLYKVLHTRASWLTYTALIFSTAELAYSANSTALLASTLALLLLNIAKINRRNPITTNSVRVWSSIILFLPSIWITISLPEPSFFDMPATAHVLSHDPSNDSIYVPLVGSAPIFPIIDYRHMYSVIGPISSILLGIVGILLLIRQKVLGPWWKLVSGLLVLLTLIRCTPLLPEPITEISPLLSLSRVVPWASYYALPSILLSIAALLTGIIICSVTPVWISVLTSLSFCIVSTLVSPHHLQPLRYDSITRIAPQLAPALQSPSSAIIRNFQEDSPNLLSNLHRTEEILKNQPINIAKIGATVTIEPYPAPATIKRARRKEPQGRWSTRTGSQIGNELLKISLPKSMTIRGIELDPGRYFSDYPRGLHIVGNDCSSENFTTLTKINNWHGTLRLTPLGLPFYDVPHHVRIVFPKTHTVQCISVRQTGRASVDWSVAKIKLYR